MAESSTETEFPFSLTQAIDVEPVGHHLYRGTGLIKPRARSRAVFGGQIIAQSLMAAVKSVSDPEFLLHSFHCYFLSPVQSSLDILYKVDVTRNGRTFSSRFVKALQEDKIAFQCLVLFRRGDNVGTFVDYDGHSMPSLPRPDNVNGTDGSSYIVVKDGSPFRVAANLYYCIHREKGEDGRSVDPRLIFWVRGKGGPSRMEPENMHRVALSYMSDLNLGLAVVKKVPDFTPGFVTSLDHSVWFHTTVRNSEWYMIVNECDHAAGETALNVCRIFGDDGTLVATCKQESLVRPKL